MSKPPALTKAEIHTLHLLVCHRLTENKLGPNKGLLTTDQVDELKNLGLHLARLELQDNGNARATTKAPSGSRHLDAIGQRSLWP